MTDTEAAQPKRKRGRPPKNSDLNTSTDSPPKKASKVKDQPKVTDFFKKADQVSTAGQKSAKGESDGSAKAGKKSAKESTPKKAGRAGPEPKRGKAEANTPKKNGKGAEVNTNGKQVDEEVETASQKSAKGESEGGAKTVKKGSKERFACETCNATFSRKYDMEKHARTHTGEKPYKCGICGKRFAQVGSLSVHMRGHTGEMPHSCDTCGKGFAVKERLRLHQRTHTGKSANDLVYQNDRTRISCSEQETGHTSVTIVTKVLPVVVSLLFTRGPIQGTSHTTALHVTSSLHPGKDIPFFDSPPFHSINYDVYSAVAT